jgi:hypothetical protein
LSTFSPQLKRLRWCRDRCTWGRGLIAREQ